jgi:hypothetical protein
MMETILDAVMMVLLTGGIYEMHLRCHDDWFKLSKVLTVGYKYIPTDS